MEDLLYTVKEVSTLLKCNTNTIYALVNSGLLPGLKLGKLKIRKISLEKFLADYDGKDLTDLDNIKEFVCPQIEFK